MKMLSLKLGKNYRKTLTFLIFSSFLFCMDCQAQESNYNPDKLYTAEQQLSDFNLTASSIQELHPFPNEFISQEELDDLIEETRKKFTQDRTELEFQNELRKFVKNFRCGHTAALPSTDWYRNFRSDPKLTPFKVFSIEDRLYIKYSTVADSLLQHGTEITAIDNIKVDEILEQMRDIQQLDGYSENFVSKTVQSIFSTYLVFLYGIKDEYKIEFINEENEPQEIVVSTKKVENNFIRIDSSNPDLKTNGSKFYFLDELDNTALLDINSFLFRDYKKYYKEVFTRIQEKQIENLIIDLRGNGGGYFPNTIKLLQYLMNEKFSLSFSRPKTKVKKKDYIEINFYDKLTKSLFNIMPDRNKSDPNRNYEIKYKSKKNSFKGKIYILTDGFTFSMASYTVTQLKHHTDCTIIGEETGGGENGSYALIWHIVILPETKVRVKVPYYFLDHGVTPELHGRGVIPDFPIEYNLEDILSRDDKEMMKAKSLILRN